MPFLTPMVSRYAVYPTTLIFQVAKTMQNALENLKDGKEMSKKDAVDMKEFEDIVDMDYWSSIEKKFSPSSEKDEK